MSSPQTRASLLVRIRESDNSRAWEEFVDLYAPFLYAYACRHGLQDSDAADICQNVLCNVMRAVGRLDYDRTRGTFRGWLLTVTRREIFRLARKGNRQRGSGDSKMRHVLTQQPAKDELDRDIEEQHRLRLFYLASARVRRLFQPRTWQAFWSNVVEEVPAREVAAALGMSVGAVYISCSRVAARIRDEIADLEELA